MSVDFPALPPAAILLLGALAVPFLRGRLLSVYLLALPLAGLVNLLGLQEGEFHRVSLFSYELIGARVDKLSLLFGYLFHVAAFLGLLFSLRSEDRLQQASALLYAGSAVGAVFAGDLITLFIYWEVLATSSVFLIWARRTRRANAAGVRYLVFQVGSGVILLAGILLRSADQPSGVLRFEVMQLDSLATALIFLAIGIKCAFPLLHSWLTDAYPEATWGGTVFLSAFTTKVAVYALARAFPGVELMGVKILLYIGALMTAFPIFYAVIENDLRRVLGYSMINQLGFMVVGIGLGTEMSINGAVSHAFNDVLFKGVLFMSMGAVLYRTGTINGSDLGGLYKSMPITATFCIVGAASISAFPLFSGFVSKSMVMTAVLHEGHDFIWLVLLFASAGVFHHAGIKIPFFAFFAHDSGIRCKEAPRTMLWAMGIGAAFCIFNGSYPWILYSQLPFPVDYEPYTSGHVISQLQILAFSALAFCWLKLSGLYPPELHSVNLDVDWTYRKALPGAARWLARTGGGLYATGRAAALRGSGVLLRNLRGHYEPPGLLGDPWPVGGTAVAAALLLALYLAVLFF
ncbi:MAG: Na(+)/H(+) antiporter subunit D [Myxococcales bacterium]|nr:Na(+)/H(+) antiporter subunit D [Myxococcales bacterium]